MNFFSRDLSESSPDPNKPHKLHHCDEINGLLADIQDDAESGYIIASIHISQIVLPPEMRVRLEPYIGKRIGLNTFFDQYYIRELEVS